MQNLKFLRKSFSSIIILSLAAFLLSCGTKRSVGTQIDDSWITTKVKSKIAADSQLNPFEVDVDTTNGVVRLTGLVETEEDRDLMVAHAVETRGVVKVINNIELGDKTAKAVLTDAVILSKVKAKLTGDPEVNPFRIDIDVVDGVVTLSGQVDDVATKNEAIKLAESTEGVIEVKSLITIGA